MVQIAETRIKDPETGLFKTITARDFDKKAHRKQTCHCPDPNCPAVLTHYQQYKQTFTDYVTRETFTASVAAHFKRRKNTPEHSPACAAVKHYEDYQHTARAAGGISFGEGVMVFNLNIPTDTKIAPLRQKRRGALVQSFAEAAPPVRLPASDQEPRVLSHGVKDAKALAAILDSTMFNTDYRQTAFFRLGKRVFRLADIYKKDAVEFFREAYSDAKRGAGTGPALIEFHPIAIAGTKKGDTVLQFHSAQNMTIQGIARHIQGRDGQRYSVSMMLHCANKDMFKEMKKSIREGKRSFLIYTDASYVDLAEFEAKKKDIRAGAAIDHAVYIHIPVSTSAQVTPWTPLPLFAKYLPSSAPKSALA